MMLLWVVSAVVVCGVGHGQQQQPLLRQQQRMLHKQSAAKELAQQELMALRIQGGDSIDFSHPKNCPEHCPKHTF